MKKILLLAFVNSLFITSEAQNSFNAIKTSQRGGILTTLVNPADIAGMPQKFDLNLIGFDVQVSNNAIDLTQDRIGKLDNLKQDLYNSVGVNGLNVRVNADIVGPSLAIALNKKTTVGLITRGRVSANMNNIDVLLAKGIEDGTYTNNVSLPYTTPNINNMSANIVGWAELGVSLATEIYRTKNHSVKIGGTIKGLFSGAYANTYMYNAKMTIDTVNGNQVRVYNASGTLGVEYSGSSDPLDKISSNLLGGPKGLGFDMGVSYTWLRPGSNKYYLKIGASILDIGSFNYTLSRSNTKMYQLNPSNTAFDPSTLKGDNIDEVIQNVKNSGLVTELTPDTNVIINLPMAYNFLADINVWKSFYMTLNLQRRASNAEDARNLLASNYLTITPRFSVRFIELYAPFSFSEIQGTTIGAGMKVGPLYLGSSSILSALGNTNKSVDVHFGIRAGFGKRFQ